MTTEEKMEIDALLAEALGNTAEVGVAIRRVLPAESDHPRLLPILLALWEADDCIRGAIDMVDLEGRLYLGG
jgi:hypothetical protein